ncbi:cytochrome ubiquinol oxidase subunit I [Hahella ganghwensis]|uniref:cytochrome ubiquinol oxidase subunit I n=1 Tax=Hahella ganghwensis TaxID=286420 RepID=UPI00035C381F|nr:cytochrome ubiquinol oxidase subunit I [Hahella ganghwensis]
MDVILLTRIQFALTASFHIIFPTLLIGLSAWLLYLNFKCLKPGKGALTAEVYGEMYDYWVRWFFLVFCMAALSGVLLSLQLDTSAGGLYEEAGSLLGGIRKTEQMVGLVFEAGFIGPMVFGRHKLSQKIHFTCTLLVFTGIYIGVCLILIRNSWMQTPSGYILENGQLLLGNIYEVIFNPSFIYRLTHMLLAGWITTACFIVGISAYRWIRLKDRQAIGPIRKGVRFIVVLSLLQIISGDLHGLNIQEYQPAKLAAIEGIWHTDTQVPFTLIGIPDQTTESNQYAVEIPYLASLLITHSPNGEIRGLNDFAPEDRPPVAPVFYAFRIMVAMGLIILFMGLWGWWQDKRQSSFSPAFLKLAIWLTPAGVIATISGWCVAEVGRQPWTIYGMLRTSNAVRSYGDNEMMISLITMSLITLSLGIAFIFFGIRALRSRPLLPEQNHPSYPLAVSP